ncbi:hypothetical protein, partial [Neisseria sp. P0021.S002]|uniref:hypothetical protein n=1 Tax=Neisseria sp. P0021.S002 TaxID=3436817 RepID=UPI003F7DF29E
MLCFVCWFCVVCGVGWLVGWLLLWLGVCLFGGGVLLGLGVCCFGGLVCWWWLLLVGLVLCLLVWVVLGFVGVWLVGGVCFLGFCVLWLGVLCWLGFSLGCCRGLGLVGWGFEGVVLLSVWFFLFV